MKKFLDVGKRGRLLPPLERHLLALPPDDRRSDIIHPSALSKSDWCPRAQWFWIKGYPAKKDRTGLRTQSIFDEGHHIHNKYQQWFWSMGNLYGKFVCIGCGWFGWEQAPQRCPKCHKERAFLLYREVPFEVPQWQMAGHADGWIKGCGDDVIIEIKSVGTGTVRLEAPTMFGQYEGDLDLIWCNLKHPFASHLKQANLYCAMVAETQKEAPKEIVFLYECKANQAAKEFIVPHDRRLVQPLIDGAIRVKEHIEKGTPPDCPHENCKQCKDYKEAA